jgi:hypothetical protein
MEATIRILELLVTMFAAVAASSGFWLFIEKRKSYRTLQMKLLIGLSHDRIVCLALKYIKRGHITQDEFDNLYMFLYKPYIELGGNGGAIRLMERVKKLEMYVHEDLKGEIDVK